MKLTKKEAPELFDAIREFIIDDSRKDHRRGSNFYVQSIVEIKEEYSQFLPSLTPIEDYVGFWETNQYITSEDDTDWSEIDELTKVEQMEETIIKKVWKEIK